MRPLGFYSTEPFWGRLAVPAIEFGTALEAQCLFRGFPLGRRQRSRAKEHHKRVVSRSMGSGTIHRRGSGEAKISFHVLSGASDRRKDSLTRTEVRRPADIRTIDSSPNRTFSLASATLQHNSCYVTGIAIDYSLFTFAAWSRSQFKEGQSKLDCIYSVSSRHPTTAFLKIMSPILHIPPESTIVSIVVVLRMNSSCSFGENTPSFRNRSKSLGNSRRPTRRIGSRSNSPRTVNGKLVSSSNFCQSFSNVAFRKANQNCFKSDLSGGGSVASPTQDAMLTTQTTVSITLHVDRIVIEYNSSGAVKLQSGCSGIAVNRSRAKTAYYW
jgi:hypothetical protein